MPKRKRKPRPECSVLRCNRRPVRAGLCGTHLLKKADQAFSRYIRERDGKCMVCGSTYRLQCMHIISRRYRGLRWDKGNAVTGCAKCHTRFTNWPLEWEAWVDDYFSQVMPDPWLSLRRRALAFDGDWKDLAEEWIGG